MPFIRTVKAQDDDDLVDPQAVLREKCAGQPKCTKLKAILETCNQRVNSKKQTSETCAEELYDWMHCVDHCVAKTLFKHLK